MTSKLRARGVAITPTDFYHRFTTFPCFLPTTRRYPSRAHANSVRRTYPLNNPRFSVFLREIWERRVPLRDQEVAG
jgi:hypothetical protein